MNKPTLFNAWQEAVAAVRATSTNTSGATFFARPTPDQWSAAENVQHLTISGAFLGGFMARGKEYFIGKFGVPTWQSRPYETIVDIYTALLNTGLKAPAVFEPQLPTSPSREKVLAEFEAINQKLIQEVSDNWSEEELDGHVIPHPAIKEMTAREMMMFTIFHTNHHHRIMKDRIEAVQGLSS